MSTRSWYPTWALKAPVFEQIVRVCGIFWEDVVIKITSFLSSSSVLLWVSFASGAVAQQITGTPGSPSATTTLDGKQLPPEPPKFGGVIKEDAKDSKPYWPPSVVPPKGAPNVLLIMTDDQGYGVSGTFGGVIPTPTYGSHRQGGIALYAVSLHGALLADAGCADHRPQPPFGRVRRHRRNVHRLSRLRFRHRSRERDDRNYSPR